MSLTLIVHSKYVKKKKNSNMIPKLTKTLITYTP